ncbi:Tn3 family transposase [Nonomuraea sp. NPDC049480]|uniref:Tn3 family transposase n=1 Tax=Nonomuraea sp. NPDC049480 TaxID=3364353 RepID=UPI00378B3AFF
MRLRTASTEALLRRFTSETTHPAYAAMLEVGRAQRTVFLDRWLRDRDLRRETESGLNVVENYNGVNDYIKFGKRGELASNRREEQELGMLCLHILQSALGLINTLMIQDTLALPEWENVLTDADRRGLTPLFHTNMTPYGEIPGARCRRGVGDTVGVEYVSRVPRPPLDGLIDDLYYLEGAPPYARLTLPPMPSALLILNLGAPFRIRAGTDIETAEYADGCVVTMPTRAFEFGYPPETRSVGVHVKPWGLAPFLPMPAAELCDRPVTVEQVWGRPAIAELRDRLATADGPHEMLTLLEEELMRRLCETAGLGLVRHTSSLIAATSGAVAIGGLSVAAGVSSTHLAQRFKELIGVTPKRLARTYRFAATVFAINPAGPIDWGDLAGGAGYFDQAHFGHEFRAFTGLTPTRYVEVRRRFLREHPGHVMDGWPLPAD